MQHEQYMCSCLYRKAYGREINDVEQPLLIHRAKRKAVDGQQDVSQLCVVEAVLGVGRTGQAYLLCQLRATT